MKVLLFNVYDSFDVDQDFIDSGDCKFENIWFVAENNDYYGLDEPYILSDQEFIEAIEKRATVGDACFVFTNVDLFYDPVKGIVEMLHLELDHDFEIYELPDNISDFEIKTYLNEELKHLYQEVIYVVDGKIKNHIFGRGE